MSKRRRIYFLSSLAIAALLVSMFGASFAFAQGQSRSAAASSTKVTAQSATARLVAAYTVNMQNVAPASAKSVGSVRQMPLLHNTKSGRSSVIHAPHFQAMPATTTDSASPNTPPALASFNGMADSATICPPSGCQPPDMALAASPQWVFQGVNTAFAVYNTSGHIQSGWPKDAQHFFNVPPVGSCDPAGPFLSDPRAFYDPNDGRFWAAVLQVEGAFGINKCPFLTLYWIAVSQTSNPNGTWNIYAFDMSLGTTNAADYTQFGFDAHAIYFNANMFNKKGTAYVYDELFAANKKKMENGQSVTAFGFSHLAVNGVLVDTVQPTEGEFPTYAGPPAAVFVNTFNMNGDTSGHDCFTTACNGIVVWGMMNPGTKNETLTGFEVSTPSYISPPNADQPGCTQCIETIDTRITATPVFNNGQVSWSIDTALTNSTQVVPGILWGQVVPQIVNGQLVGASLYQSGYFGFEGDQDASFGAMMPDLNGNLIMVYDTMSSTLNPSIAFTGRRATFPLGSFHDAGKFLKKGVAPTLDSRWGDYEATSYDGFSTDHIWMSSQYSGANQDWATFIGETQFRFK
ncbi:MAG TPA: hypothetical protein VEV19_15535 [Ktedonobacteraceae bacterium]|nr:hypothetical protein [Ktedonobacteraceae bacterium]